MNVKRIHASVETAWTSRDPTYVSVVWDIRAQQLEQSAEVSYSIPDVSVLLHAYQEGNQFLAKCVKNDIKKNKSEIAVKITNLPELAVHNLSDEERRFVLCWKYLGTICDFEVEEASFLLKNTNNWDFFLLLLFEDLKDNSSSLLWRNPLPIKDC